jgi:hypothetical protein
LKKVAESKYAYALARALKLRKTYLTSGWSGRKNTTAAGVPNTPVWEATARLAG